MIQVHDLIGKILNILVSISSEIKSSYDIERFDIVTEQQFEKKLFFSGKNQNKSDNFRPGIWVIGVGIIVRIS